MKPTNKKTIQYRQTHDLIFNTVSNLIETKDYDKITIREICDACNISIGNFYHHYNSKEEIIDEGYHKFDHFIAEDINNRSFPSNKDKMLYFFMLEFDAMTEHGLLFSIQFFKHQLTMQHPYITNKNRYFYIELYKCIEIYIKDNHIKQDPHTLVDELLRISRGTIYDWCLHKGSYDLIEIGMNTINKTLKTYENQE